MRTVRSLRVVGPLVNTGIMVKPGDTVSVTASGLVDFGGAVFGFGAPILGPDGDNWETPSNYPAPNLKKNSLIIRAGGGIWQQGGSSTTFTPLGVGPLELSTNDGQPSDNSRGWDVVVTHTPLEDIAPVTAVVQPPTVQPPTVTTSVQPPTVTSLPPTVAPQVLPPTVSPVTIPPAVTAVTPPTPGALVPLFQVPDWVARALPGAAFVAALIALARQRSGS